MPNRLKIEYNSSCIQILTYGYKMLQFHKIHNGGSPFLIGYITFSYIDTFIISVLTVIGRMKFEGCTNRNIRTNFRASFALFL